jgi:hypothetical protein
MVKMKRIRSLLLLLLCAVLSVQVCLGCTPKAPGGDTDGGETPPGTYPSALPSYEARRDDLVLPLYAFWSPPITEEQYRWMAECGYNGVIIDNKYDAVNPDVMYTAVEYCGLFGLDAYIARQREGTGFMSTLGNLVGLSAFKGVYCDEPLIRSHVANMGVQADGLLALGENYTYLGNLVTDVITGGLEWYNPNLTDEDFYGDFDEYADDFVDKVLSKQKRKILSATSAYPLLLDKREHGVSYMTGWLAGLGKQSTAAKRFGADFYSFINVNSFHNGGPVNFRRRPNGAELRWQSYAALAYGARGIEEWAYMSIGGGGEIYPETDWSLINYTDFDDYSTYFRTETYYSAQAVHEELSSYDHVLLSFDWQGVMLNQATESSETQMCFSEAAAAGGVLESNRRIAGMTGTGDYIVGCFLDKNNYDGFMIVNFDETRIFADDGTDAGQNTAKNRVKLTFKEATKAVVYTEGVKSVVNLSNGVYECELEPGEGRFVIPVA